MSEDQQKEIEGCLHTLGVQTKILALEKRVEALEAKDKPEGNQSRSGRIDWSVEPRESLISEIERLEDEGLIEANGLRAQIESMETALKRLEKVKITTPVVNALDCIWGLVYPKRPESWEYPGQVYRHVKCRLQECQKAVDIALRELGTLGAFPDVFEEIEEALRQKPDQEAHLPLTPPEAVAYWMGVKILELIDKGQQVTIGKDMEGNFCTSLDPDMGDLQIGETPREALEALLKGLEGKSDDKNRASEGQ